MDKIKTQMKVFENQFLSVLNDENQNLLKADWKTATANMNKSQHRASLRKLFNITKSLKPSSIIFDLSSFYYAMDESEQSEVAQLSHEIVHEGLEKCALIPSKGMMEQLAVEQAVKKVEADEDEISIRFFRDELTAKQWLDE